MIVMEEQYSLDLEPGGAGARGLAAEAYRSKNDSPRWTIDEAGRLELPAPRTPGKYVLLVSVASGSSDPARQHLVINAAGRPIYQSEIRFPTVLAAPLPWPAATSAASIDVIFDQPQLRTEPSASPGARESALAISNVGLLRLFETKQARESARPKPSKARAVSQTLSNDALMQRFASLGDNCEFGVVQRCFNAEPMDLFRFARVPLHTLERMLANNFAGLDAPENIKLELRDTAIGKREFIFCHQLYDEFESHPWIFEGEQAGHHVFVREQRRVSLLLRLMLDDIRQGSRVLVLKRNSDTRVEDIIPVFRLLRSYGPNWLLWVEKSQHKESVGTVELLEDGLMRGCIDEFAPYEDVDSRNAETWLTVCRRAYELWTARREPAELYSAGDKSDVEA